MTFNHYNSWLHSWMCSLCLIPRKKQLQQLHPDLANRCCTFSWFMVMESIDFHSKIIQAERTVIGIFTCKQLHNDKCISTMILQPPFDDKCWFGMYYSVHLYIYWFITFHTNYPPNCRPYYAIKSKRLHLMSHRKRQMALYLIESLFWLCECSLNQLKLDVLDNTITVGYSQLIPLVLYQKYSFINR